MDRLKHYHESRRSRVGSGLLAVAAACWILSSALAALAGDFTTTGTYTGDGSATHSITGLGFAPDLVIVKSSESKRAFARTVDMPAGYAKNLTKSARLEVDHITSLDADGFSVGNDVEVNRAGITYYWVAMQARDGLMEIGQYAGTGTDYRAVPLTNLTPDAALVLPAHGEQTVLRHAGMNSGNAYFLDTRGAANGSIVDFGVNRFFVAQHKSANELGETYYYVAWQAQLGSIALGSYVGNGVSGQTISGAGLNPEYVLIANSGQQQAVHRPASETGDASLYFGDLVPRSDLIKSLDQNGFQAGNDLSVNGAGTSYYWLAFGNPGTQSDLGLTVAVDNPSPRELDTVAITLSIDNSGPDAATGATLTAVLPMGLTFQSATPSQGSYDAGNGIWSVGNVAVGQTPTMTIAARVDVGAGGRTLACPATVATGDQQDTNAANNGRTVVLTVLSTSGADLQVTQTVDDTSPDEGQTVTCVITVTNFGPDVASNVRITDLVPSSLGVLTATPDQGSYAQGSGLWSVGTVDVAGTRTLTITANVLAGTSGTTITNTAALAGLDQVDPNGDNNSAAVELAVNTVDLQVLLLVDEANPIEGTTVNYTVVATNLGPSAASGVQVADLLPVGLTFVSATPAQGTYDDVSGLWNVGAVARQASVQLALVAEVAPGSGGSTVTNTAVLVGVDQAEVNAGNNSSAVAIDVGVFGGVDLQITNELDQSTPNVGDLISYTVTVLNAGPGPATGIEVRKGLPSSLLFVSAVANKGNYARGSSKWIIGDLAEGFQAVLNIQGTVLPAAAGSTVADTASITAAAEADPQSGNNRSIATFSVANSDLYVSMAVDNAIPTVGDTVAYRVVVGNAGPNSATDIRVTDQLPVATSFVSAATSRGAYDSLTGVWLLGSLNPALSETLTIMARVEPPAAGTTVTNTASVTNVSQADLVPTNNTAQAAIVVPGADLVLTLVADVQATFEGMPVHLSLNIRNGGPGTATGILVSQLLPPGLQFDSAAAERGTYNPVTGVWSISDLANGEKIALDITATVADGAAGTIVSDTAAITAASPADPVAADNVASVNITILADLAAGENVIWPLVGPSATVQPGDSDRQPVLTIVLVNRSSLPDTLHALTVANLTAGGGTAGQMDAEWQEVEVAGVLGLAKAGLQPTPKLGSFLGGQILFNKLDWAIPAGDTLRVTVSGGPSLQARDAAHLRVGIRGAADLDLNQTYTLAGTWPLVSGQILDVDGFVAAQATVVPRASGLLSIGSQRNLALTVDLPGNGYLDDTLYSLSVKNRGSAQPVTDITRIEAWADDGDGVFEAQTDRLLGPATYSGERWQLTGLREPVPAGGKRFYFTLDVAETAQPARDIRLSLPAGNGFGVEMFSGNDGPVDEPLENPHTLGISVTDRVILTPEWYLSGVALPGANDAPLLQFVLNNTYDIPHRVQSLTFTNTTVAPAATPLQRDAVCQQLDLRLDGNDNGRLDGTDVDPRLASGVFGDVASGRVTFSGLTLDLPASSARRMFVTADVGLMTVADGDRIKGQITSRTDINVSGATVVANWPLQSGTEWVVNGMTRAQIKTGAISVLTLGPGEGPVLAMDLTVPANGYADDELSGISFENTGSATAADLNAAELWADDGDGLFNAALDRPLGPLAINGSRWTSTVLAETVPRAGLHLFASLTVADTPQDSVTVRLGVPTGGITVSSGNDGPLDLPVAGGGTLVISTSPLRTSVDFATSQSDSGQSGTITMTVRNAGSEVVTDVLPALAFVAGDGLLALGSPQPASIASLAPGQVTVCSWPFVAMAPGMVVMEGNARGMISGPQVRRSIVTPTSPHRVFTPVSRLELYPTANLPFSINRGQQGLVPLTLTFKNPGTSDVANAQLTSIRLRLLETAAGPGIVPAELLDRVIVSEGTNVYLATTALPTGGDEIDLVFSQPVVITGSEPVTLGVRLDLRLNSSAPSFLISIEDATWLVGSDAVNGAGVTTVLGQGSFPVRTGQATLVAAAAGMNVAVSDLPPASTVPGQANVLLAEINLSQSLVGDNSSAVDVGRLAFVFHGPDGRPLSDVAAWLSRLSLQSAFQEHYAGIPTVEQDSLVVLHLSAPLTISGSNNLVLRLFGDIAISSPLGVLTTGLGPVDTFDARDGNMNNPVPVTLTTGPLAPGLTILGPAGELSLGGNGMLPPQVSRGTRDLTALNCVFANDGAAGTSAVAVDTLTLRFFNAARQPLDPDPFVDRLRIMRGTEVLGTLIEPGAVDGVVAVPLAVQELAPGESVSLRMSLDITPISPTGTFEVVVAAGGLHAVDALTGLPVAVVAAAGTSLPLSSGVASLVVPADELRVSASSLMPPLLVPLTAGCPVLALEFTNPAGAGVGDIELNGLTLVQEGSAAGGPDLSRLLATAQLRLGEDIVASTTDLAPGATSFTLVPATGVLVRAGQTIKPVLEIILRADATPGPLQVALLETGIQASPPGGGGLAIRILPVSGQAFPFATKVGNVGGGTLDESYANFPNPFAAGRESTNFAFSLRQPAQVSLRVMTPHGELVATILADESREAGFYQTDVWPGLNGNGMPVHNGVYLAELVVQYTDGSRERLLRKVAVVR